jgi:hypothetical protein
MAENYLRCERMCLRRTTPSSSTLKWLGCNGCNRNRRLRLCIVVIADGESVVNAVVSSPVQATFVVSQYHASTLVGWMHNVHYRQLL